MENYLTWFADYCADGEFYAAIVQNIIQCFVGPGQVAIDVGAHRGRHTFHLCEKVGTAGRVYAVEPIKKLAAMLQGSAPPQLRVIEAAITDFHGETNVYHQKNQEALSRLEPNGYPAGSALDVLSVPARTLDGIVPENDSVRFIKLAIEGAEFSALRGARRILQNDRPLIVFQRNSIPNGSHTNGSGTELNEFWDELGYVVVDLFGRSSASFKGNSTRHFVAAADDESLALISNLQIPLTLAAQQLVQKRS